MKLLNSKITIVVCTKDYVNVLSLLKSTNLLEILDFVPIVTCFYHQNIEKYIHKNLKIITGKNKGIYSSFNSAIREVKTSHYLIIGDDDKFIGKTPNFFLLNHTLKENIIAYLPVKKGKKVYSFFKKHKWKKLLIGHFPSHSGGVVLPTKAHDFLGLYETKRYKLLSDSLFIRKLVRSSKFIELYFDNVFFEVGLSGASSNFKNSLSELYKLRKDLNTLSQTHNFLNIIFLNFKLLSFKILNKIFKPPYRIFNYYNNSFKSFFFLHKNETKLKFNAKKIRVFLPGPSVSNFKNNQIHNDEYTNIYVNNSYVLLNDFKTTNNFYFTSDIKRAEEFIKNGDDIDITSILYPVDFFQLKKEIIKRFDYVILPKLSFFLKFGLKSPEKKVELIGSLQKKSKRYRYGFGSLNSCLALICGSVTELEIWGADFSNIDGAHFKGHKGFIDKKSPFLRMKTEFFKIISKLDCSVKINGKLYEQ